MRLSHQELIEEYFQQIRETYPSLSLEDVKEICQAPFKEVREGMESGAFPTIRLKFFGTFLAYPKRVAAILKHYDNQFKEMRISPTVYFKKKQLLETYLKSQEK